MCCRCAGQTQWVLTCKLPTRRSSAVPVLDHTTGLRCDIFQCRQLERVTYPLASNTLHACFALQCPFAHPGEKAKRRCPKRYRYSGTACPEFRRVGAAAWLISSCCPPGHCPCLTLWCCTIGAACFRSLALHLPADWKVSFQHTIRMQDASDPRCADLAVTHVFVCTERLLSATGCLPICTWRI